MAYSALWLFALFSATCAFVNNKIEFTPGFTLQWSYTGAGPDDYLVFDVTAPTHGWVGIGFSPKGSMAGADIVVGGIDTQGKPYLHDMHGISNSMPIMDKTTDYELQGGQEDNNSTHIQFRRKRSTCDPDDFTITNDTIRVIWAYGETDMNLGDFRKHAFEHRGVRSVRFFEAFNPETNLLANDPNVILWDVVVDNVQIPTDYHTLYWCSIHKKPENLGTHHLIRFEPLITKGNEAYLHHMLVYHCSGDMSKFVDKPEPCFEHPKTERSEMYECTGRYVAIWAVGGQPLQYPDNMGFPMFEPGDSDFYLLEVHYDNSAYHKNIKLDNSGMRLYLTPQPRPVEVGSFTLGAGVSPDAMTIPPGLDRTTIYGFCPPQCTKDFPDDGIYIMNGLLHEHLLGVAVRLRHIRNGVELPPIFQDNHYDFNYQDISRLPTPRKVLPNDTLLVECDYDSAARQKPTFGGFSTSEEMCFVFFDYYPRTKKLHSCFASPTAKANGAALGLATEQRQWKEHKYDVLVDSNGNVTTVKDAAEIHIWDKKEADRFMTMITEGDHSVFCQGINDGPEVEPDTKELKETTNFVPGMKVPKPSVPYREISTCGQGVKGYQFSTLDPRNYEEDDHSVTSNPNQQSARKDASTLHFTPAAFIVIFGIIAQIL